MRTMPRVRRVMLRMLRPLIPALGQVFGRLEAPTYHTWLELWQGTAPATDEAIRRAVGASPGRLIVTLPDGPGAKASRDSLAGQAVGAWVIAGNAQALAREAAAGGLVLHLTPGDTLPRHALAEFALAAAATPVPLVVYGDEDAGGRGAAPWFKTAFDPDLLLQQAAFGRAVAYDAGLLVRHGLLGLRGHALMLAAARAALAEAGPGAIAHVAAVLLRRRSARAPIWRQDTDRAAIAAALATDGQGVVLLPGGETPRLRWPLPATPPRVTAIVPTRDGTALMEACMEGLLRRTDYPALDILVCDNDSSDPALLARFAEWSRDPRFRVLPCPGSFNYSAINNRAARVAEGEILLLLNNDTEVQESGWLREMVSHAVRPGIGAVGARLLFPSGRVQHSGTVLGLGGIAGHDMLHSPLRSPGPYDLLRLTRRVSAVTAACLAVRREAFLAVGGFDEEALRVAYNDVDLCLKLRAAGLANLVTPHAALTHKESATRGDDMSPAHRERWEQERAVMRERWGPALDTDPYYSPSLALDPPLRVLAYPPRRLPPWHPARSQG